MLTEIETVNYQAEIDIETDFIHTFGAGEECELSGDDSKILK